MRETVSHTALLAGQQIQSSDGPPRERRIPSSAVRELCGGVSDMTLWRWLNDPDLGFPKPIYIARRRYWREADVLTWLDAQAAKAAA
jgi:predicted DNA-binding transcriptional regulator AlpA